MAINKQPCRDQTANIRFHTVDVQRSRLLMITGSTRKSKISTAGGPRHRCGDGKALVVPAKTCVGFLMGLQL